MRGWTLQKVRLTDDFLHPYPALAPLCFFLSGALPVGIWGLGLAGTVTAGCVAVVGTLIVCCVFPNWRRCFVFGAAGACLAALHVQAPWRTYRRGLYRDEGYVQVQGVVADSRLIGLPELAALEPKRNIRLRLLRSRCNEDEPWRSCYGTVEIADPLGTKLGYGQTIEAEGALRLPFKGNLPHQADLRTSLRTKGIEHRFYPQHLRIIARKPAGIWRVWVLPGRCRDVVLRALLRNIDDPADRRVLAAMTLGMQSGITPDDRERFRNSGSLHLFAVSGLHVGIVFSILLLLLTAARVPFNVRYLIAPALLFIYVLFTGAAPSALRAWLMLGVWSVGRGLRLTVKPVNTVLAVALALLILNPLNLFQIGSQYSFLLVLAILVGWRQAALVLGCMMFREYLIPLRAQSRTVFGRIRSMVTATLAAMGIFWLGSAGLTLWYNQLLLPFSILGNALTGAMAWLVLLISFLKLPVELLELVVPFDVLSRSSAGGLSWAVGIVRSLAGIGGDPGLVFHIPKPPLWSLFVYYIAVAYLLIGRCELGRVCRRFCLVAACLVIMLTWRKTVDPPPDLCIFTPATVNIPVIVVTNRWRNETIVINTGPKLFSYTLAGWLRGEGVSHIDHLILLTPTRDFAAAAPDVIRSIPATSITVLSVYKRYASRTRKKYDGKCVRVRILPHSEILKLGGLTARRNGTEHIVTLPRPDGRDLTLTWKPNRIGPSTLTIQRGAQHPISIELNYESKDRLITLR